MKRAVSGCLIAVLTLAGCAQNSDPPAARPVVAAATPASTGPAPVLGPVPASASASPTPTRDDPLQRVVARINNDPVTLQELLKPLLESHGLTVLYSLLQLHLAQQDAAAAGTQVSEADFQAERDSTLGKMFKDNDDKVQDQLDRADSRGDKAAADRLRAELRRDHEQLLGQFLAQKNLSRSEFDNLLRVNTYLRKIAEPLVNKSITEQSLRAAFNQLYGETVLIRHIQLSNQAEVADAQRRLAKGEKFEDVAMKMSHNHLSGPLGGELPRFSRQAPGYPENFKDVAFGLQPGQVSDPVEANGAFHLIKMEARFPPQAVRFEAVHDAVRRQLFDAAVLTMVKKMREDLQNRVRTGMKIEDPSLKAAYDQLQSAADAQDKQGEGIKQDMDRERRRNTTQPAPEPSGPAAPATPPAPPATEPAAGGK